MRKMFKCTERSAQKFLWKIKTLDLKSFKKNFGFLSKQGATLPVLMENVKILNMPPGKPNTDIRQGESELTGFA